MRRVALDARCDISLILYLPSSDGRLGEIVSVCDDGNDDLMGALPLDEGILRGLELLVGLEYELEAEPSDALGLPA